MFDKVLVANRGEIALRIIRTLIEMDIASVAVYSDADRDALFTQEASEAYHLGPSPAAESYLNVDALLAAAEKSGAQAIHPGYGFLAENAAFAERVEARGLTFIGPSPEAMRRMGDKVAAREAVAPLRVPLVPGTPGAVRSEREAREFAEETGFPVAVKAAGGGGGRGIRVVENAEQLGPALEAASREAEAYFKNGAVYLEKYFHDPRHVEFQVLGDTHGNLVHLGERDCSTQRRHQKLIEETPSPAVDRKLREEMGEAALAAARSVGYTSAGTVEFLLARDSTFYFLEMNTRIQVEHGVTECVSGVDLIREMICIAAGAEMSVKGNLVEPNGHAIEVRVNAEDPLAGFRPTPTTITRYLEPGGIGVRVDSGVYAGFSIPSEYDSLMAKLITWAPDREGARRRMNRALGEFRIDGPATTIPFLRAVLSSPTFIAGDVGTRFVEEHLGQLEGQMQPVSAPPGVDAAAPARGEETQYDVEVNGKRFNVRVAELQRTAQRPSRRPRGTAASGGQRRELPSPMHGTVVAIKAAAGEAIEAGTPLFVIEAMKMENEIVAHRSGTIGSVAVATGETVEVGTLLATIN